MSIARTADLTPVGQLPKPGKHHQRLDRLRDQERQRRLTVVALGVFSILVVLVGSAGIADFYLELSTAARIVAWAFMVTAAITLAVRFRKWIIFESSDAVSEAENARPELGQRLRTSHDYQTHPDDVSAANPDLLQALETQTQEQVLARPIEPLGRSWPIGALMGFCLVIAVSWLAAFTLSPEWRVTTGRLLLLPIDYTDVQLEPLPPHVDLGEDLVVRLNIDGRPIESAVVNYRTNPDEDWNEIPIVTESNQQLLGDLTAVIPDCQQDLEIRILASPLDDDIHHVAVRIPLVIQQWDASVQPPSYTGLPAITSTADQVRIPEGSSLDLTAHFNRPPASVDVDLQPESVTASPAELSESTATLSIDTKRQPIDVVARAAATDGVTSESTLLLNVIPDRAPALKFLAPAEDAEAIATAELQFTLEAFDDYGIESVELRYRIDNGPEQTLWQSSPDDSAPALAHTVTLPLEDLDVSYPQAITYYAVAVDNRAPEAQRATSDLRFIDIRPFSRDYEFSDSQCNCKGECLTLEKLIKQQREILGRTFATAERSASDAELHDSGTRLASQEDDLREKTKTLTQALEAKVGPMPSLTSAIDWMNDAVEDLQSGAVQAGQESEENALAKLIAARRNLRKILKKGNPQARLARNIDKQQQDNVRKPERKSEKEKEKSLAQIREQIEQLAKNQESFCQSAQACKQSSSSSSSSADTPRPSREQLAEQQQQSESKARQIRDQLSDQAYGELAPKRVDEAADSIMRSMQALAGNRSDEESLSESIDQATDAAEKLKQLSEHLAQRQHPDFDEKLAVITRKADQLSDQQKRLSDSLLDDPRSQPDATKPNAVPKQTADEQRHLATRTEDLDDLINQLMADSTEQDRQLQESLASAVSENPPRQAASAMNSAADLIMQRQNASASAGGSRAAESLKRLANGLKGVQQSRGETRLEALTLAEKQAAALLKESRRATTAAQRGMAASESRRFAESLRPITIDDPELADAVETLARFDIAENTLTEGLREIDLVLQRRIQESIVGGAMQQAVGPVPPAYADMVEDYYRALSEDVE